MRLLRDWCSFSETVGYRLWLFTYIPCGDEILEESIQSKIRPCMFTFSFKCPTIRRRLHRRIILEGRPGPVVRGDSL